MAHPLINKAFYMAILHFDESEENRDYYYRVMDSVAVSGGREDTVRNQILRVYAMLFCDERGAVAGQLAGPEDVEATADRLYTGQVSFEPSHWYRMRYHFPTIDEDNFDRFAALVVADLSAGPLHEAALRGEDILLYGEPNPLVMTREEREHQRIRRIHVEGLPVFSDSISL